LAELPGGERFDWVRRLQVAVFGSGKECCLFACVGGVGKVASPRRKSESRRHDGSG
jgi:hypothetical protein